MIFNLAKNLPLSFSLDDLLGTGFVPDFLIRMGIRKLLNERLVELQASGEEGKLEFFEHLRSSHLAVKEKEANKQHYEVPTEFFLKCLGKNLKYSCSLYENGAQTLDRAEVEMFDLVAKRAELKDGQNVLELGCGWGSLSLYMARRYPNSEITVVSNSSTQKNYIDSVIAKENLYNLNVITENVVTLELDKKFDRVVSIEMFEHMRNYSLLLNKVNNWLNDSGKLFVHIFCHCEYSYPYEVKDETDWMTKYFFEGGIMPSFDIFDHFQDDLKVTNRWQVNGDNYSKTCEDWLKNMDNNKDEILLYFRKAYGSAYTKWFEYWRIFHMACSELFKKNGGKEWFVGHYLLEKQR